MRVSGLMPRLRERTLHSTDRLSAARAAFRDAGPGEIGLDAAQQFSARHLGQLATALPLDQVSLILDAERTREEGLALARSGDDRAAAIFLARAAAIGAQPSLSHHARITLLSFQLAADAYLWHRRGDPAAAIHDLEGAIVAAVELETLHGHDMEFQRIHLARNILRVRIGSASPYSVAADSIALLLYIAGNRQRWPIATGHGIGSPARLSADERAWAIDDLLVNLAQPDFDIRAIAGRLPLLEAAASAEPCLAAAVEWCRAMIGRHRRDYRLFLHHAIRFFESGRGRLGRAAGVIDAALDDLGFLRD